MTRVVVVGASELDAAQAHSDDGATVVIVAASPAAGACAASLAAAGGRVAVFAGPFDGDAGRAALSELVDELFSHQ